MNIQKGQFSYISAERGSVFAKLAEKEKPTEGV